MRAANNYGHIYLGIAIPNGSFNELIILRLASLLSTCIRIKLIVHEEKRWMLNQLHLLLLSPNAPPINVPLIFNSSSIPDASVCKLRINGNQHVQEVRLASLFNIFPLHKNDLLYRSNHFNSDESKVALKAKTEKLSIIRISPSYCLKILDVHEMRIIYICFIK